MGEGLVIGKLRPACPRGNGATFRSLLSVLLQEAWRGEVS